MTTHQILAHCRLVDAADTESRRSAMRLAAARREHDELGGYLLDLGGGCYLRTDDHPCEHRSFGSVAEAVTWAMDFAAAGYDEPAMLAGRSMVDECRDLRHALRRALARRGSA